MNTNTENLKSNSTLEIIEDAKPYRYYRAKLLPPSRVLELSKLNPKRVLKDVSICWLLIFASWIACAMWTYWWVVMIAIPVIGTQYYALQVIGHDGIHRRLFNSLWLNDLFADLIFFAPMGATCRTNGRNHIEHHRYLGTTMDPDRHKHCSYNKMTTLQVLAYLTGIPSLLTNIKNVFFKTGIDKNTYPTGRYSLRNIFLIIICQSTLIFGLSYFIGWWSYPVLWLLPMYVFMYLGDNFRSFAEHSQPLQDNKAENYRLITYMSNPIEKLFFAPMNMNYHTVHHLWPSIPYYNLPIADKEIKVSSLGTNLEWRKSYLAYIIQYVQQLPLEKSKNKFKVVL